MFRHFEGAIHLAPTGSRFKPFFEHDFEKLELIKAVVHFGPSAEGWQTGRLRQAHGQAFSDSGYPYDAGMQESRLAYPDIGPLQ